MTTLDTDRIALSNELHTLAECFALEATQWKEPGCRAELERVARHLAELARQTTRGNTDLDKADAYARAATVIYGNVTGCRRFFRAILTPPNHLGKPT